MSQLCYALRTSYLGLTREKKNKQCSFLSFLGRMQQFRQQKLSNGHTRKRTNNFTFKNRLESCKNKIFTPSKFLPYSSANGLETLPKTRVVMTLFIHKFRHCTVWLNFPYQGKLNSSDRVSKDILTSLLYPRIRKFLFTREQRGVC